MYTKSAFNDAIAQQASLPGWTQEYRQVSAGRYHGTIAALEFPNLAILRERINVGTEQVFSAPRGRLVFYYYYDSARRADERVLDEANATHAGFTWNWIDRIGFMRPGSDLLMVVLDPSLLGGTRLDSGSLRGDVLGQGGQVAQWLAGVLDLIAGEEGLGYAHGQLNAVLPDLVHDRLSTLYENSGLADEAGIDKPEAVYRRLRERLHDAPGEPLTVSALSRELGLSAAALRRICAEFAGSPLDTLLVKLRLNGARRALIEARGRDCRVCDIAMDWGFMHWSRFAARYRLLFGERPSETLGRPASRATPGDRKRGMAQRRTR